MESRLPALFQQSLARVPIALPMLALLERLIIQNIAQRIAQKRPKKRDKSWSRLSQGQKQEYFGRSYIDEGELID